MTTINVRLLKHDDTAGVVRWLDDSAYLAGFGETRLDPLQIEKARQILRRFVDSKCGWIATLDNIRIAALFNGDREPASDSGSQFFLVPRLALEWSVLERQLIEAFSTHLDRAAVTVASAIARSDHSTKPQTTPRAPSQQLTPVTGRRALLLGPLERNKNVITILERSGFAVTQSMSSEEGLQLDHVDLIISSGYDRRLSKDFVKRFSGRVFNLHAGMLPWGRGIGLTLFSQLLSYPLGASIHLIDSGLDTGDLVAEQIVNPFPGDTLRTIYQRQLKEMDTLFEMMLTSYLKGTARSWRQDDINPRAFARSRADFEDVLRLTTLGYDTPLSDIRQLRESMRALKAARTFLISH